MKSALSLFSFLILFLVYISEENAAVIATNITFKLPVPIVYPFDVKSFNHVIRKENVKRFHLKINKNHRIALLQSLVNYHLFTISLLSQLSGKIHFIAGFYIKSFIKSINIYQRPVNAKFFRRVYIS